MFGLCLVCWCCWRLFLGLIILFFFFGGGKVFYSIMCLCVLFGVGGSYGYVFGVVGINCLGYVFDKFVFYNI